MPTRTGHRIIGRLRLDAYAASAARGTHWCVVYHLIQPVRDTPAGVPATDASLVRLFGVEPMGVGDSASIAAHAKARRAQAGMHVEIWCSHLSLLHTADGPLLKLLDISHVELLDPEGRKP